MSVVSLLSFNFSLLDTLVGKRGSVFQLYVLFYSPVCSTAHDTFIL